MTFIENIFVCLTIPLFLSLFFSGGRAHGFTLFIIAGMSVCLLSAYVSSFFTGYYGADAKVAVIEITPVCEEILKLLPLLFYLLIFEPEPKALPGAALAIAVGFATFENVCYLTENGAEDFTFLLIPTARPALPPSPAIWTAWRFATGTPGTKITTIWRRLTPGSSVCWSWAAPTATGRRTSRPPAS